MAYGKLFYRMAIPYFGDGAGGWGAVRRLAEDIMTVVPWGLLAILDYYPRWDTNERMQDMWVTSNSFI